MIIYAKIKTKTFKFASSRRHSISPKCIQLLLAKLFLAYVATNTHYIKSASVPVPAFDANAKCFGGGWFKAVRWYESRDYAGDYFSMTCPRRISLRFATTLEEESRVNARDKTRKPLPLRREPWLVNWRVYPLIFMLSAWPSERLLQGRTQFCEGSRLKDARSHEDIRMHTNDFRVCL